MALWNFDEQQMIRAIDSNNESKFELLQSEVENNDLQLYLGFEFYQELIRNTVNYSYLLNGGTYYQNGVAYRFSGLKSVCAYLLYARYVRQSYLQDTFSGFVAHTGNDFQRVSGSELANQEARYKEIAGTYWDECVRYLHTLDLSYFPQKSTRKNKISCI
jgi:hypothetical protein